MGKPNVPPKRQVDGVLGRVVQGVHDFMAHVTNADHLWGEHVQVTFAAPSTPTKVSTGLTGPVRGYRVERATADVRVWDATPPTLTVAPGTHWLQSSTAGTVTIYFY